MEDYIFGFYLGISLILAIGPQNLFVIEQGLKRNHVFLVCFICSVSDFIFIVLGTVAFSYFSKSNPFIELLLNLLLLVFVFNFIWKKLKTSKDYYSVNKTSREDSHREVVLKVLAFTYLNPHVYWDTIFIIGGFSRELILEEKMLFVIGATTASFLYFFSLGYASSYFASFINNQRGWRWIDRVVIFTMLLLSISVLQNTLSLVMSVT